MSTTPENKIKKMVKAVLAEFRDSNDWGNSRGVAYKRSLLYDYWPVPSGFGASSLDCIVCYCGVFIAIETKAPGKVPTPRQELSISQIRDSNGLVFVIDGVEGCDHLRSALMLLKISHRPTTGPQHG